MSYYPTTPWSNEIRVDEDETSGEARGGGGGGGWWKNAFKKPWKRKEKAKQETGGGPSNMDQWRRERQFGAFPPIMSQLGPNLLRLERRNSDPTYQPKITEPATESATEDFDLPQYEGQKRPRLDSVFNIHGGSPSAPATLAGAAPRAGGAAVGRSSSFSVGEDVGSKIRERAARRERVEPVMEEKEEEEEDVDGERVGEDSNVEDRTLERRQRRMGVVRDIPQLPHRSTRFDWNEVHSLPEISHHRRRPTPAPAHFDMKQFDLHRHHHRRRQQRPLSPPRAGGPAVRNIPHPAWGSPPMEDLPTLSEEGDSSSDIKGFDNFKLY